MSRAGVGLGRRTPRRAKDDAAGRGAGAPRTGGAGVGAPAGQDDAAGRHRYRPVRRERPDPQVRTVTRRDASGTELSTVELPAHIFGLEPNRAVLHQVVTAQLAAARAGTQSTKTRAEVRGGGAKPFRQKGTGRARQGSTRSPQWVGGGVALGPKPRSYRQRTPKKMVRLALCSALSDRAAESRVALVDRWPWETPRTKDAREALEALDLSGRVLVVLGADDQVAERSFRNLQEVSCVLVAELNAYEVLRSDWLVFTDASLPGGTGLVGETDGDEGEDATEAVGEPAADDSDTGPADDVVAEDQETAEAEAEGVADDTDAAHGDDAEAEEGTE